MSSSHGGPEGGLLPPGGTAPSAQGASMRPAPGRAEGAPALAWPAGPRARAHTGEGAARASAVTAGRPWPMGASLEAGGLNVAVFSEHAERLELCLFDPTGEREVARLVLPGRSGDVWHGFVPQALLAQAGPEPLYGLRAHGPWLPHEGHRFNPHKLLLDPCAREIVGRFEWRAEHFGGDAEGRMDVRDNAAWALKSRALGASSFDWGDDRPLRTPLADSVLYEAHVKSLTQLHPGVPEALRGSYAGLAHEASLAHLKRLGITAVSLLPVHQRLDEQGLVERGLVNHWGYNTLGFFAVEPRLASSARQPLHPAGPAAPSAQDEFRAMVKRLHAAGIEVILDVVFNHTAEGDASGPTLCWRGLDNRNWYRHRSGHPGAYENWSGCGNTLELRHPRVMQWVLDSLRHWVAEMHVDGFRFDLAPLLGRGKHGFDAASPLLQAIAQDPLLQGVKLIAEPWDLGPGPYRLGEFPHGWGEWNDRFRDGMRRFWLGGEATRGEFAHALCASAEVFRARRRTPAESIDFITAHDGFTLRDLVSFEHRHNGANGEGNRDGHHANHSWNCGVEGPSANAAVQALRTRLQRAMLACLLLGQGTPMLCAGDEIGRTQDGNNNAYCQDNETSWLDWDRADLGLLDFTARLVAVRRSLRPLSADWYDGPPEGEGGACDLCWIASDGQPLEEAAWRSHSARALGALIGRPGKAAGPLLFLVNPDAQDCAFLLPAGRWQVLIDSAAPGAAVDNAPAAVLSGSTGAPFLLPAHSVVLLGAHAH